MLQIGCLISRDRPADRWWPAPGICLETRQVISGANVSFELHGLPSRAGDLVVSIERLPFQNSRGRWHFRCPACGWLVGVLAEVVSKSLNDVLDSLPRLEPILGRPGGVLSGGEQQILALARCLCAQPKLILLDEPTEGIQPSVIEEIAGILLTLKGERGLTIVLVEQNLDFIRRLSDRVLIIQKGRMTGEIPPDHLGDDELVAEFVGMSTH
jgi:ABC-type sugar transport system ATPase subunit